MLIKSPTKAKVEIANNVKNQRLVSNITQAVLAERSGVPLPTIRKFEQTGNISLESFLKIQSVLGGLENILSATEARENNFKSIDDVLKSNNTKPRQRASNK